MNTKVKKFNQTNRKIYFWLTFPLLIILTLYTRSAWNDDLIINEIMEIIGVVLIVLCIAGRCWSILYIGDKKNKKLVDQGPYRYTRNPLYFSSAIGLAGFGFMFESFFLGAIMFLYTWLSFKYVAAKEAADLRRIFGDEYVKYCDKVPEFIPNLNTVIQDRTVDDQITISPKALKKTFWDACLFLLLFPVAEIIVGLHESGALPALWFLY